MSRASERLSRARTRIGERRVLAEAFLLIGAVRVGLWVASFRAVHRAVETLVRSSETIDSSVSIDHIVRAVKTAGRYVPGTTCLVEAMATRVLLGRYDHPAELRIGVRREDREAGQFGAHAWVESAGEVVIGGGENLSEFVRLPPLDDD